MDDPPDPPGPSDPAPGPAADQQTIPDQPAAPPPAGEPGTAWWPLRRSIRDRKVKGVAGGVATAADLDPTLVRLLFVVAAFSGWGIVAYIALAVVLQDETVEHPARPLPRDARRNLRIGLGIAAVVAAGRLFDGWFFGGDGTGLPLILIVAGAAVLWARRDQSPSLPPPPPAAESPLAGPAEGPAWAAVPAPPLGAGIDWRSTGRDLLRLAAAFVAVGALLALLGGAFLVTVGAVPMRLPFLPAAVGVVGLLGLVVAVVRRARLAGLLVSGGVLVAAAALAVGLASFPGTAGNHVVVVGPGTPLLDRYEHSVGRLVLDLRDLTLEPGVERRVVAKVGTGQLTVIVPPAVALDVKANVGAGNTTLLGREQSGPGVEVRASHQGAEGGGHLDLDLDVGVGQVSVELAPPATYDVTCQVPPEVKGDGTDRVSCPHPVRLAGRPMTCSVAMVDPEGGGGAGRAFCRARGDVPPKIGLYGVSCDVPADSDEATCARFDAAQMLHAQRRSEARNAAPATTPAPTTTPAPATTALPAGASLLCGDPDATGVRTCTTAPPSTTSTTAPATFRCREDPVTRQLSCVPSPG